MNIINTHHRGSAWPQKRDLDRRRARQAASGAIRRPGDRRRSILHVLDETNSVIDGQRGAALILNLHSNTLPSRMQKLGVKKTRITVSSLTV